MNTIGYIKLHRCIADEDDEFWLKERFTQAQAWVDILLKVTHRPIFGHQERRTVQLQAGEMVISTPELAARWQWHRHTVTAFLNSLLLYNRISIRKERGVRVLQVINWSKYQDVVQPTIQPIVQPTIQPTEITPINNNKKGRKRNITKKVDEPLSSFLPPEIISSSFFPALTKWEAYRRDIKKPYTSPMQLEAAAEELKALSGGDAEKAMKIVNHSIAGGYSGLFALNEEKQNRNERIRELSRPQTTEELLAANNDAKRRARRAQLQRDYGEA